eukprot:jgi/Chrzof1/11294/Cz05g31120.t1
MGLIRSLITALSESPSENAGNQHTPLHGTQQQYPQVVTAVPALANKNPHDYSDAYDAQDASKAVPPPETDHRETAITKLAKLYRHVLPATWSHYSNAELLVSIVFV